jgi:nitrite reductase/ring-hydroxylating ferredoxin subunit
MEKYCQATMRSVTLLLILVVTSWISITSVDAFVVLMVKRGRRKGGDTLRRTLDGETSANNNNNNGRGQEITGVTLPKAGELKGWEFGERKRLACANVGGKFYGIQGACPRCAFDLWQGDIIDTSMGNDAGFEDLPRIACPTCSTTYSLISGKFGPPLKRKGLAGFVGNLAKQATRGDKPMNAEVYQISRDDTDGRVFCSSKAKGRRI